MNQLKPFREILGPTKAGKTGTLRAEWTSGDHTTEKFFDYVLKKTIRIDPPRTSMRLGSDAFQGAPSAGIWLPAGVRVGWGVSEVQEAFVTSLAGTSSSRFTP